MDHFIVKGSQSFFMVVTNTVEKQCPRLIQQIIFLVLEIVHLGCEGNCEQLLVHNKSKALYVLYGQSWRIWFTAFANIQIINEKIMEILPYPLLTLNSME